MIHIIPCNYCPSDEQAGRGTPGSSRKKTRTLKEEERLTREAEARTATLREQVRRLCHILSVFIRLKAFRDCREISS